MKIAYFSPLNPRKSGISDYSEALLPRLAKVADIDLWVDGYVPENREIRKNFRVIDYLDKPERLESLPEYDISLFHIGNNPYFHAHMYDVFLRYGGTVVLHDFVLYYLVTGYYLDYLKNRRGFVDEMDHSHGDRGVAEAFRILNSSVPPLQYRKPHHYPLNRRLIERAKGLVVHSTYTRDMIPHVKQDAVVKRINLIGGLDPSFAPPDCREIRKRYGVENGDTLLVSLGYVAPTKRNDSVIRALHSLRGKYRFKYIMAGEGDHVVPLINELGMSGLVKITGYVPRGEFDGILASADIVVNLRYPSMGEASITLVDALTAGKPCLVSDYGWFSELPDDAVVKVAVGAGEAESLAASISRLIAQGDEAKRIGKNAREYAMREHGPEKIAEEYISLIDAVAKQDAVAFGVDHLTGGVSRFLEEIGADEGDAFIIRGLSERIAELMGGKA